MQDCVADEGQRVKERRDVTENPFCSDASPHSTDLACHPDTSAVAVAASSAVAAE